MSLVNSILHPRINDGGSESYELLSAAEVDARIATQAATDAAALAAAVGYINVKSAPFNAVGDGTTDDTVAIQLALDTAATVGAAGVFIPAGSYAISQAAATPTTHTSDLSTCGLVPPSNIHAKGAGIGKTILVQYGTSAGDRNTSFFTLVSVTNVRISDMEINGGYTGSENGGVGIWGDAENVDDINSNIVIERVYIHNTRGYGIGMQYGRYHGFKLLDSILKDTGADGIDFKNRETTQDNHGIIINNLLIDNPGINASLDGQTGIDVRGIAQISNIDIINLGISAYERHGIRFRQGNGGADSTGGTRSSLSNFSIKAASSYGDNAVGVYVADSGINISNGAIDGASAASGVVQVVDSVLPDTADDTTVSNVLVQNFGNDTGDYAFASTSDRVKFIGCRAVNGDTGFRLGGGTGNALIGNSTSNVTTPKSIASGSANSMSEVGNTWGTLGDCRIYDNGVSSVLLITPATPETNKTIRISPKGTGDVQLGSGTLNLPQTITTPGTTGNQTINKAQGRVNIAAAGTSVVVTNSVATSTSQIIAYLLTNDATAKTAVAVPGSGTFTIYLNAAATGEVAVGFTVLHGY